MAATTAIRSLARLVVGTLLLFALALSASSALSIPSAGPNPAATESDAAPTIVAALEGDEPQKSEPIDRAQKWLSLPQNERDRISLTDWQVLQVELSFAAQNALEAADEGNLDNRILLAQLAELGPAPSADEPAEEGWLAKRRARLNERLEQAQEPLMALRDRHARAVVLGHEVGQVVRQRQRIELLSGSSSPMLPGLWIDAAKEAAQLPNNIETSVVHVPERLRLILAGAILLLLLLAWFAHHWILKWIHRVEGQFESARIQLLTAFGRDMLGIVSPLVFFGALIMAIRALAPELPGMSLLATALVSAVFSFVVFRWLGRSLFMPSFKAARVFQMPPRYELRAYHASLGLALVMGAESAVSSLRDERPELDALGSALSFVVIAAASLAIWRLLDVIHRGLEAEEGDGAKKRERVRQIVLQPIAQVARAAAVLAALVGAFGFVPLAHYVVISTVATLSIIFGGVFVFKSINEAAGAVFHRDDGTRSTAVQMLPILFGFLLVLSAMPLIALSWGFTLANIVDVVLALRNGVAFGNVRLSFGGVFRFALVFAIGYALTRWLQQALQYIVLQRMALEQGAQSAILTGVGYIGLALSALVAITAAGLDLSSLAFVAGALSVGVGFGLQPIVANFISGIILLIERPIREGDWIEVGGFTGHVRRIAFRSTHIETFDKQEVIIPNSELITGMVTNNTYASDEGRISLAIDVAYETDMTAAKQLLLAIAADHPLVLPEPPPKLAMTGFGESAIQLRLLCFVKDVNTRLGVTSDLYFAVAEAAQKARIDIPFPRRDIRIMGADGGAAAATS